eukprot:TRINITY_DN13415_c0_g1_i1.p1 TRINITY_DN13415_c0_g1~~TRINITY_DN13415_c0_g1_i1.p1  ORF type:complete len:379 (-),score=72.47 TRINITY_DN13415_c0_g1_i1:26-1162(-)
MTNQKRRLLICAVVLILQTQSSFAQVCSGVVTMTGYFGSFQSNPPNEQYTNNLNCGWIISVPGSSSITLTFTRFATEAGYDIVRVYQGTSSSGVLQNSYSGSSIPSTLTVWSGSVFVQFTTDSSITNTGWAASYAGTGRPQSISGNPCNGAPATVTGSYGSFADRTSGATYANNMNCAWSVSGATGVASIPVTSIRVAFTQFNTESTFDYVTLYNGIGTTKTQVFRGSGTPWPLPQVTFNQTSSFTVTWYTDSSVVSTGWVLVWAACTGNAANPNCFPFPPPAYVPRNSFHLGWLGLIIPLSVLFVVLLVPFTISHFRRYDCFGRRKEQPMKQAAVVVAPGPPVQFTNAVVATYPALYGAVDPRAPPAAHSMQVQALQ